MTLPDGASGPGSSAAGAGVPSLVVVGEALVDLVVRPDLSLAALPGGGPYNTARAAARLGLATTYAGALSHDRFGDLLVAGLDGVTLGIPGRVAQPTTLAIAEIGADGGATYGFHFTGTSALEVRPADLAGLGTVDAVHTGTLGLVLEPLASVLEEFVLGLPPGVLLMVDANCRPSATPDRAAYTARLRRILARADVLKASVEDLAWLLPDLPAVEAARSLGVVTLVTAGGAGASVVTATSVRHVPAPAVAVIDTVGAGDTFGGAFLAAFLAGPRDLHDLADVERCVQEAVVAAGLACTRAGADPPTRAELTVALEASRQG